MIQPSFGITPLYQNKHYNNRLQLYDIRLGTSSTDEWTWNRGAIRMFYDSNFAYGNGGTNNNGNVYRMDHFVPTNESASEWSLSLDYYGYDDLNRITGIWENKAAHNQGETSTGLTQQYIYDRYGNRTVNNAMSNFPGVFNAPFNVEQTTNRLLAPNGTISYNAVGNQTTDNYSGSGSRTYDANNKLVSAAGSSGTVSYSYNANGSRVSKAVNGTVTTWYIYGLGGELVAEYPAQGAPSTPNIEYGYRNGELLIEGGCDAVRWRLTDHLGSTRMTVGTTGALANVKRTDYLPFGEEIGAGVGPRTTGQGYSQTDCWRQKFTGYERDAETGLDYFGARYFASLQGRFTGVDPLMASAHTVEPQSWNRYAYALNNPLKLVDVRGLYVWGDAAWGSATDEQLRRRREDRSLSRNERNAARDALNFRERFRTSLNSALNAASALPEGADKDQALRGVHAYGNEGLANGVTVTVGDLANGVAAQVSADQNQPLSYDERSSTFTANVIATFDRDTTGDNLTISTGHEGSHIADRRDFAFEAGRNNDALNGPFNLSRYQTEFRAYSVSSAIAQGLGLPNLSHGRYEIWNSGWAAADRATLRANGINNHLRTSATYQVTPQNQGPPLYPRQ